MHPSFSKLRALSHEELFLLLRANPQPLLVKNARGELLYANEAWQNTVGRAAAGPGKMPLEAPDHGKAPSEQEQAAFDRGEEILREEVLYLPGFDAPRRIATSLRPVFNEQGQPAFIVGSSRDITEQHQLGQQNDAERKLLESLAANMPLQAIMSDFIVRYEAIFAGTMAAVMLLDARRLHLRHGAAPSLPPHYCAAIDGVAIGAGVGSCGAAAFDQVRSAIAQCQAPAQRLKLELTESLVLDNVDDTIAKMHALKDLGVSFSMDDFGTGHSSLSYLTRLPLDQLKIDQSFVRNIGLQVTDSMIIQTIIGMGNNLGIEVLAEGVETEEQRAFLAEHGCKLCQGYLFGRPMPAEAFNATLREEVPA